MKIIIEIEPKEIAALLLELAARRENEDVQEIIDESFEKFKKVMQNDAAKRNRLSYS